MKTARRTHGACPKIHVTHCQRAIVGRIWCRDVLLSAALERLIEYLLESAGAAMLLMVKEAIVLTVGWFTRARKREEVEGLAIETRLSASWTSATLSGRDCSWIGQQSWKSRFKRPSKHQSKWSDGVTVLISDHFVAGAKIVFTQQIVFAAAAPPTPPHFLARPLPHEATRGEEEADQEG